MKLIEWMMNGKFEQANSELLKEFAPDNEHMEDKSPGSLSELFLGFVPIWTTGNDILRTDPSTPTFSKSVENMMKIKSRAIEDELKLVNEKLEKVIQKTKIAKDNRTSLWELFQKTKMADEKTEHKTDKSSDEKLHQNLRKLHRTVHPEVSDVRQKSQNQSKNVTKGNFINTDGYRNRNQMPDEDIIIFPYRAISRMSANHTKSNMSYTTCRESDTNWTRECWIKSDAEYLVLEL